MPRWVRKCLRWHWVWLALAAGQWWSPLWRWEVSMLLVLIALLSYTLDLVLKVHRLDTRKAPRPTPERSGEAQSREG
jgi:hypothetical protein